MEEKRKYRVTNPVAWGGRRERGEILELTEEEAVQIGEVEPVEGEKTVAKAPEAPTEPEAPKTGDYAPQPTADDVKAEEPKAGDTGSTPGETPAEAPAPEAPTEPEAPQIEENKS